MRYFFLIIIIFSFSVCIAQVQQNKKTESFVLNGKLIGRDTGYIVLWYSDTSNKFIRDAAYLKNGKFEFKGKINEPSTVAIKGSSKDGNYASIYLEGGHQTIMLEENDFYHAKMNGSQTQREKDSLYRKIESIESKNKNIYDEYDKVSREFKSQKDSSLKKLTGEKAEQLFNQIQMPANEIRNLKIAFIARHPNSYVSPNELYTIISQLSLDSAELLFNAFTRRIKNSRGGILCSVEMEKKKKIKIGTILANFKADDINGQSISLSQFKGKYVLLEFRASWCVPCRKAIPHLKEVYNDYHSKGIEIITISIDDNRKNWEDAIKKEGISNWHNVIKNDEINKIFQAVQFVPAQLLIDLRGHIIWNSSDDNTNTWESILKEKIE